MTQIDTELDILERVSFIFPFMQFYECRPLELPPGAIAAANGQIRYLKRHVSALPKQL